MNQKIYIGFISGLVLIVFIMALYSLIFSSDFAKEENFLLQNKVMSSKEVKASVNWIFKEYPKDEYLEGFMDEGFIVKKNNNVYIYDNLHGKAKTIASSKDFHDIGLLQLDDHKILMHYVKVYLTLEEFLHNNQKAKDYNYYLPNEAIDTTDFIEIYDNRTGINKKIFEYKRMWRLAEEIDDLLLYNFQSLGGSKNGRFVVLCIEDKLDSFKFYIYDTENESKKEYSIFEDKQRFDVIKDIVVSNEGDYIYFTGSSESNGLSRNDLYGLDLLKDKHHSKLLQKEINTFSISYDEKYILYDYYEDAYEKRYNLACLEMVSMKNSEIAKDIITRSFSLSHQNRVAYLENDNTFPGLYVSDFGKEVSKKCFVYEFKELNTKNSIFLKWLNNDNSILVSYGIPSLQNSSLKKNSLVIDVN